MAVETHTRISYMINRHCGCTHDAKTRVTTDAGRHRSFKCTARMATIAGYVCVCAIKLEPGAEVIERVLCLYIRCGGQ